MSEGLRTRGLRRRVVGAALALTGVSMAVVAVVLMLTLGDRLRAGIRADLDQRAQTALQLDGTVPPQEIARRVGGNGVSARLDPPVRGEASGGATAAPAPVAVGTVVVDATGVAPTPAAGQVFIPSGGDLVLTGPASSSRSEGGRIVVRQVLPATGDTLTLAASTSLVGTATDRVLQLLVITGLSVMALGAVVMSRLVGLTLAPLDGMTRLAASIAGGERGRRLRPDRTDTEMGRAAEAFDGMLDTLETAVADAEDAQERLRRFLADASHELRTPLSAMAATAETLLRSEPDRERVEELSVRLVRESRRAARLLEDLTTAARLDDGTAAAALHPLPLDLGALAAEAANRAEAHLGRAVAVATPEGPMTVAADHGRILQVLANLLDNAHRWSPDGPVTMTVTRVGGAGAVHVDDHGPGVPEADRERIFERLVRLQDDRARESGGSGLGLAISRELARAHGGELVCASGPHGARFTLTLPAAFQAG
ncbi:MAG: HAMP domain-containing sensor histidine kinase [Thermoleophilia bacterium]